MYTNSQESIDTNDNDDQRCEEKLQRTIQYQKILSRILGKIRASVELEALYSSTCQEIAQQLEVERVIMCRFDENWGVAL